MNPAAYLEMSETEEKHWWFSGRRAILSSVIARLHLPVDAKILEVGCGTGGNLHMLAKFGKVHALEMNAVARAIAMEKTCGRYEIRDGCCPDDISFEDGKFDLICLFDVLEHIDKDLETLDAIKKLLKPKGCVLITVPAYQWLFGLHDQFLHHKRRYTSKSFLRKANAALLHPTKISYFNTLLFPLISMVRLKEKLLAGTEIMGTGLPHNIINVIFRKIFGVERFILRYFNLPFGVSLLCVLKKYEDD